MPQRTQAKARKHTPATLLRAEAIEPGTKIGALTGLGIQGGEGMKTAIPQARHPERPTDGPGTSDIPDKR